MIIRSRRRWLYAFFLAMLLVIANHILFPWIKEMHELSRDKSSGITVQSEDGSSGHVALSVNEDSIAANSETMVLRFSSLATWDYDPKTNTPPPDAIKEVSGREVNVVGFMFPLEQGAEIKTFALCRSTQTCCYGERPDYNQYLLVEMSKPVRLEQLRPVLVNGKFLVEPNSEQGYIYRMEGGSIEPALDEDIETEVIPEGTEELSLSVLEGTEEIDNEIPEELLAVDGKIMYVNDFIVGFSGQRNVVVGEYWFDGCCMGRRPTINDSILVCVKPDVPTVPLWDQRGTFLGKVEVNRDRTTWSQRGILKLRDAAWINERASKTSPYFIPIWLEATLLAVLGAKILWIMTRISSYRNVLQRGDASSQILALGKLAAEIRTGDGEKRVRRILGDPHFMFNLDKGEQRWAYAFEKVWRGPLPCFRQNPGG